MTRHSARVTGGRASERREAAPAPAAEVPAAEAEAPDAPVPLHWTWRLTIFLFLTSFGFLLLLELMSALFRYLNRAQG
jgi:hypothetical protein